MLASVEFGSISDGLFNESADTMIMLGNTSANAVTTTMLLTSSMDRKQVIRNQNEGGLGNLGNTLDRSGERMRISKTDWPRRFHAWRNCF